MRKFEFKNRTNHVTQRHFNLVQTIEFFLDDKRLQKRSARTVKTYQVALNHYAKYCAQNDLTGNEDDCVKRYVHYMTFEKVKWDDHPTNTSTKVGVSARTVNNSIRFIRVFYNWAVAKRYISNNPASLVSVQTEDEKTFEMFTDEEIEALIASPRRRSYTGFRDYVMMMLLIDTGMRVGEITALTRGDIDLNYRQIEVRAEISKSKRTRIVPISHTTVNLLKELFEFVNISDDESDEYIFLTQYGERYYGDTFAKMLKQYAKRAGIEIHARVSPHTFRHYFAVKFLRNGGDPFALMKILGHTDMSMTQRYVQYASAHIMEAHDKASPVESIVNGNKNRRGSVKFK